MTIKYPTLIVSGTLVFLIGISVTNEIWSQLYLNGYPTEYRDRWCNFLFLAVTASSLCLFALGIWTLSKKDTSRPFLKFIFATGVMGILFIAFFLLALLIPSLHGIDSLAGGVNGVLPDQSKPYQFKDGKPWNGTFQRLNGAEKEYRDGVQIK